MLDRTDKYVINGSQTIKDTIERSVLSVKGTRQIKILLNENCNLNWWVYVLWVFSRHDVIWFGVTDKLVLRCDG